MQSHADWLRQERVFIAGAVAGLVTVGVGVVLCRLPASSPGADLSQLLNGPAVAMYGVALASVLPASRVLWPALLLGVLGLTHPLWLLALGLPFMLVFDGRAGEDVLLLGLTGAVLSVPMTVAARHWWPAVPMGVAIVVAGALSVVDMARVLGVNELALGAAPLHLGIAWTMFAIVVAAHRSVTPPWVCACCGYDLLGSVEDVCPECGSTGNFPRGAP